jgi:hypothetical protein
MNIPRVAAILTAFTLTGVGLGATVILPATLADLVIGAPVIVHGHVVAVESRWAEGRRQIETIVTLRAAEYLKGNLGDAVTFKVPGGQMGPYRSVMIGAPTFHEGDEVVLFLNAQGPAVPWISGLNQGLFRVAADASGTKVVVPGVSLVPGGERQGDGREGRGQRLPLQAFAEQVKALVRDGRPR